MTLYSGQGVTAGGACTGHLQPGGTQLLSFIGCQWRNPFLLQSYSLFDVPCGCTSQCLLH